MNNTLVTIDQLYAAKQRLPAEVVQTPMLACEALSRATGAEVWLKAESLQVTGSYKSRAAFTIFDRLPAEARSRGAAISSSGNFAQAFAYMGTLLGIPAVTVMAENASPLKVARTRAFGGEIVYCEDAFDSRWTTLARLETERGLRAINHFEDPNVIAGHGTLGLEMLEQLPEPDTVLIPVSSGGLIAGVALAIKSLRPATRVIGLQPSGSAAMLAARQAGKVVHLTEVRTICDALTAHHAGELTFAHVEAFVDDLICVEDDATLQAVAYLFEQTKLVVEPGGAIGVAALLSGRVRATGKTIVLLSGGNIDGARMTEALSIGDVSGRN